MRDEATAEFIRQSLSDTGYCCRNLLGWNYDEAGDERINVGTGGVRATGSHKLMVDMLDNQEIKYKLLEAPRGSYKSTVLQGYIVRRILRDPNIRIFYVSKTDKIALEKAIAVRNALESELITHLFGPQKGFPWEDNRFTVAGRTDTKLMSPTFSTFSMESMPTGGRANVIIVDDPIDQENVTTADVIEKSKRQFAMLWPFVAKGCELIVVGTRYGHDDLFEDLENNSLFMHPKGQQVILDAGVTVVRKGDGSLDLEELDTGLTFPHLSMDMLRDKLHGMSRKGEFFEFSCQYLNKVPQGTGSLFRRTMFQPLRWADDMEGLTGYLLTDTAVSQKDEGCHSVLVYVGLDAADNLYVLDLRVGHWQPGEFVDNFFEMLEKWQNKVNHAGECWENIALTTVFHHTIASDQRSRRIKTRTIEINRYTGERKHMRIQRMHAPMLDKRFYVVDTVPKYYADLDGDRELWNPEGFQSARSRIKQPSGELVDQFIRFPAHPRNDIADSIAIILETEKKHGQLRRYCRYKPYTPKQKIGITEQRRQTLHQELYHNDPTSGGDWWSRTSAGL